MLRRAAALAFLVVACTKETSPVGPVGSRMDLRSHLKPDVVTRAPPDEQAKEASVALDVHGVRARLTWRHFEDGPNKYLLSAQWFVDTPAAGVSLESTGARGMPATRGRPTRSTRSS